ncbi:MAG: hypothetical protein ACJAT4_001283 [Granulosicoccus sp.]|jgi:hypothetical protein
MHKVNQLGLIRVYFKMSDFNKLRLLPVRAGNDFFRQNGLHPLIQQQQNMNC